MKAIDMGRLTKLASRITQSMTDHSRGPLIIAQEVTDIVSDWAALRSEAEGKSASQWLESVAGRGKNAAWFQRRSDAVVRVGEHARRIWDHQAIVWAVDAFADEISLRRLDRQVMAETREAGNIPLPLQSVRRIARELGLMRPNGTKRVCGECERLRAILVKNGLAE